MPGAQRRGVVVNMLPVDVHFAIIAANQHCTPYFRINGPMETCAAAAHSTLRGLI